MGDTSYTPRVGDTVIGKIEKVGPSGWAVSIESLYLAHLPLSDIGLQGFSKISLGDMIVTKLTQNDGLQWILTVREPGLGKITRGQVVHINPTKFFFPFVDILSVIKKEARCLIIAGFNGVVLITTDPKLPERERLLREELGKKAVFMWGEKPYTDDLPHQIGQMIKQEKMRLQIR